MDKIKNLGRQKVYVLSLAAMIFGALLLNHFFTLSPQQTTAISQVAEADLELFASKVECMMEDQWNALEVQHSDVTGLKTLINKKRKRARNAAYRAKLASYRTPKYPPVPVKYQGTLDSAKVEMIRSEITAAAKKYLGRPYIYAAKGPEAFDCSGYTSYVMRLFGVEISTGSRYQARQGQHVDLKKTKVGDLLFFSRYGKGGGVTHVGLIIKNGPEGITVIHANGPSRGIMIENVTKSSYWKNKILFARNVLDPIVPQNKELFAEK